MAENNSMPSNEQDSFLEPNHNIEHFNAPTITRRLSNSSSINLNKVETRKQRSITSQSKSIGAKSIDDKKTCLKQQKIMLNEISKILKKDVLNRSAEDNTLLNDWKFLVPDAEARKRRNETLKQRTVEEEESLEVINHKTDILVDMIENSSYTVIYTGAGISTSALIPDYRGPNGLWTQLKKTGTFSITKNNDLSTAKPTYTHMAIKELCRHKLIGHVVSQNCDGLHIRSGIAQTNLSEIHGNMFIEVCASCNKQYYRQADTTEKTSRFRHKTGRKCHSCKEPNNNLLDTIVLYGERSRSTQPMNWARASRSARRANLIICIGSSLKTLRHYENLWPKKCDMKDGIETKLVIINLQYTSKDKGAVLKINGKSDLVMKLIMQKLNIEVPDYDFQSDPLRYLQTPFTDEERTNLNRSLIFDDVRNNQEEPINLVMPKIECSPERIVLLDSASHDLTMDLDKSQGCSENIDNTCQLPGWLGKSLTSSKSSYSKRKRHGNKGRKQLKVSTKVDPDSNPESPVNT